MKTIIMIVLMIIIRIILATTIKITLMMVSIIMLKMITAISTVLDITHSRLSCLWGYLNIFYKKQAQYLQRLNSNVK